MCRQNKNCKKIISVAWTAMAQGDLADIVGFIAASASTTVANRVLRKIEAFAVTLSRFPNRGRIVPELKFFGVTTYREIIISPWRILYRVAPGRVYVMALVDSRRNVEELLFNRFMRGKSKGVNGA